MKTRLDETNKMRKLMGLSLLTEGFTPTTPWGRINVVEPGESVNLDKEDNKVLLFGKSRYGGWRVVENPTGSQPFVGSLTVKSFDEKTKLVTFTNGVVVGPKQ